MKIVDATKFSAKGLEELVRKHLIESKPGHSARVLASTVEISDLHPVGQKYRIVMEVQVTPLDKKEEPK